MFLFWFRFAFRFHSHKHNGVFCTLIRDVYITNSSISITIWLCFTLWTRNLLKEKDKKKIILKLKNVGLVNGDPRFKLRECETTWFIFEVILIEWQWNFGDLEVAMPPKSVKSIDLFRYPNATFSHSYEYYSVVWSHTFPLIAWIN